MTITESNKIWDEIESTSATKKVDPLQGTTLTFNGADAEIQELLSKIATVEAEDLGSILTIEEE